MMDLEVLDVVSDTASTEASSEGDGSEGALHTYMQRFAKSMEEDVGTAGFDTKGFKWNIDGLIGDEPTLVEERQLGRQQKSITPAVQHQDMSKLNHPMVAPKALLPAPRMINTRVAPKAKSDTAVGYQAAPTSAPRPRQGAAKALVVPGATDKWDMFRARFADSGQPQTQADDFKYDLDAQIGTCCAHCSLPVGDFGYCGLDGKGALIHGECMAQQMLQSLKEQEEQRQIKEVEEKKLCRSKYDIGWDVERIPRNIGLQAKLKDIILSHGLCCLVLQEGSKTVKLASTAEPSAAINLEYLSLALQVRRKEGREPIFSLDPVDGTNSQVKRFEPEWLAGTSVGDVLFQADYHLKELSMGEYAQPVVGMKSCFDMSEAEDRDKKWNAREWFMVRKAEVQMSEDNVLIPRVQMGVEAREQVLSEEGSFEDAPITRKSHPMVRYAESFTKNFDLIAERKSVIYHLRELAKASVLAKFLVDADMQVEESWFNLAGEVEESCAMEIPQLWNDRACNKIRVKDGEVLGAEKGIEANVHGVYGGVNFGLNRFGISKIATRRPVAAGRARAAATGAPAMVPGQAVAGLSAAVPQFAAPSFFDAMAPPPKPRGIRFAMDFASLAAGVGVEELEAEPEKAKPRAVLVVPSGAEAVRMPAAAPTAPSGMAIARPVTAISALQPAAAMGLSAVAPGAVFGMSAVAPASMSMGLSTMAPAATLGVLSAAAPGSTLKGVDLNLNQFSLDTPAEVKEGTMLSEPQSADTCASMNEAFWSCVNEGKGSMFEQDDLRLLQNVFNPNLSDRHAEGDRFAPPDTSLTYISQLRCLVKEEEEAKQKRKDHFFSIQFVDDNAGPLFPASWTPMLKIVRPERPSGALQPRSDCNSEALDVLRSASPAFEKKTEDGTIFRIYRAGSLEVRSTQEHGDNDEIIGAVFSARDTKKAVSGRRATGREKIVKVTQYVEKAERDAEVDKVPECRYYTVLETQHGGSIVTEMTDGTVSWEENVADLEDRNAKAKVVRTAPCLEAGATVQELKNHRSEALQGRASGSMGRKFATDTYTLAMGGVQEVMKANEKRQKEWEAKSNASC